jgi:DNA modification methylase
MIDLRLGDCLEILPTLEAGSVDAVITDPPYGVDLDYNGSLDDSFPQWQALIVRFIPEALRVTRGVATIPTSKYEGEQFIYKNFSPIWRVCWYKGASATRSPIGFKDWETTFIFGKAPKQLHDYFTAHANMVRKQIPDHPCPKPLAWAEWFVEKFSHEGDTILDPFMGSGTTGVACVKLGRNFIGIEKERGYYELAQKRIQEAQQQMVMAL